MALDGDLIGKIVSEWARTEIQKKDILNYNGAMLAYTDKARVANLLGLSDEQKLGVTPFPSPVTLAIGGNNESAKQTQSEPQRMQQAQPQQAAEQSERTQSDWWKYLVAAVAASGMTLGGMALNRPTTAPVVESNKLGSVQLEMEGFPDSKNIDAKDIKWGEQ